MKKGRNNLKILDYSLPPKKIRWEKGYTQKKWEEYKS